MRAPGAIVAIATALLTGCAGEVGNPAQPPQPWYREAPAIIRKGVYIGEYYTNSILGYAWDTKRNLPPICSIPARFIVDLATDPSGNLIVPDGGSRNITVFKGPAMCGTALGTFPDAYGQPSGAATHDAVNDTIYVANLQAAGEPYGNVSVCTLAKGCSATLSSDAIRGQLFAVAEDPHGNVFASGYPNPSVSGPGSGASLVYWKNGRGNPIVVTAYRNATPGGLEIDAKGNLIALDTFSRSLFVYNGCPQTCVAHGPFALKGESVFGKVDSKDKTLQVADFEYGQIDVYRYRGTQGVTYLYSYGYGLSPSGDVEGIAIDPAPG